MARLAEGARTLLGFDMVRVPFDQTIEAELLGAEIDCGDASSNCAVRSHPLSLGDLVPEFPTIKKGRAETVVEAIWILRGRLGPEAAVIGGVVGPFTIVCQLAGVTNVVMDALRRPEVVRPAIDLAVQVGIEYARLQVDSGADAICVEDMSASLDLTSPRIYEDLILPAQRRLIAGIRAPVILHVCGTNTKILHLLSRSGAAALSLESKTDLGKAVAEGSSAVIGGVAPVEVLLHGTTEDVRRASTECLEAGVHVLAPGCGIPVNTPIENLQEMVRVAHGWRA
jgi:[methyl-Co(III) methanol-specific corrinoid protein]:coenzyme M methyltransferase